MTAPEHSGNEADDAAEHAADAEDVSSWMAQLRKGQPPERGPEVATTQPLRAVPAPALRSEPAPTSTPPAADQRAGPRSQPATTPARQKAPAPVPAPRRRGLLARLFGRGKKAQVAQHTLHEQLFRLRHDVLQLAATSGLRSVLITSAVEHEGKTTVAAGLAMAVAQSLDSWALLVETDLRRPDLAERLGLSPGVGLIGHVLDGVPLRDVIQPTRLPKLSVICAGPASQNASQIVSSDQLRRAATELRDRYADRLVVFDAPPILATADPLALSVFVDGIIFVVKARATPSRIVRQALSLLPPEKLLGVVLNGADVGRGPKGSYYSYYATSPPPSGTGSSAAPGPIEPPSTGAGG